MLKLHQDLNPKLQPKTSDFEDPQAQAVLLRSMAEYEVLICTVNAFPDEGLKAKWIMTVWANAHAHLGVSEMSEISAQAANLAGPFLTWLCSL